MAAKFFLVLCASALLMQSIAANPCGCGRWSGWETAGVLAGAEMAAAEVAGASLAAANLARLGYVAPAYAPANIYSGPAYAAKSGGGAFGVAVTSPNAGTGVSVLSENSIGGILEVAGSLPVLAGVAFEGTVPSAGAAGTAYSCGCGGAGIAAESLAANGISAERAASAAQLASLEIANLNRGRDAGLTLAGARFARPACGCY